MLLALLCFCVLSQHMIEETHTCTSLPILGQDVAAVALADEGARQVHTQLLTAVVL